MTFPPTPELKGRERRRMKMARVIWEGGSGIRDWEK